jgi:glucuronoarabinoxylan endo-1,4-beta-xylanase
VPGGRTGAGGASAPGSGGATGAGGSTVVLDPTACSSGTAQTGDVTVSLSSLQQKISGFGVSTAWAGNFNDPAKDPDTLWSTTTGAGLTLHRIRIGGGTTSETKIAQKAVTYGVKVWAAPWEVDTAFTDRAMCPTNDSCTPPPKLIDPAGWANRLAGFVKTMKDAGVDIYAISAENEPDSKALNHTVPFTPDELATWIGSHLGPALAPLGVKVMAPETMNGCGFPSYFSAIQKNPAAWEHVGIFASHEYGCGTLPSQPAIAAAGKEYWETEVDTGSTSDDSSCDGMGSALKLAETIHNDLTKPNLNAWHYWWLYAGGCSGLFDTTTKVWTKRFWIMGNFSRFVRPGYLRVSTSGAAPTGVLVTAYTNPSDGTVAIVAINKNSSASSLSLFLSGVVPCTLTPWVTSATDSIVARSPITVANARFTASLEAKSVTTFVGKP